MGVSKATCFSQRLVCRNDLEEPGALLLIPWRQKLRPNLFRNRFAEDPISDCCDYFAFLAGESMDITHTTRISGRAADGSEAVSASHLDEIDSGTVNEPSMLLPGSRKTSALIILVVYKECGVDDVS